MQLVLDLGDAGQFAFPMIIELPFGHWFKVSCVVPPVAVVAGRAASAHTGVIAQAALVQVGVIEGLRHVDAFLGIQGKHLAQEMHGLVSHGGRERVQVLDAGLLWSPGGDVALGGLARKLHVVRRGRSKEISDELELLDGRLGLEQDSPAQ